MHLLRDAGMIFGYTQIQPSEIPSKVRADMERALKAWPGAPAPNTMLSFKSDGQCGKVGLTHTLRQVGMGDVLAVRYLSDVARDLHACVKTLVELIGTQGVIVFTTSSALVLSKENKATEVVMALAQAHERYVKLNRKNAIAAARQAGATIGRPVAFSLDEHRKAIADLTNAVTGDLPSVRKLAEKIGCGNTKAMQLIQQYKVEAGID